MPRSRINSRDGFMLLELIIVLFLMSVILGIEENLRNLVQRYIHEKKSEITLKCEMLVRAYDPCFSCSVH